MIIKEAMFYKLKTKIISGVSGIPDQWYIV